MIHRHGTRSITCPGSNLPPESLLIASSQVPGNSQDASLATNVIPASHTMDEPRTSLSGHGVVISDLFDCLSHKTGMVDHIPKASRSACVVLLISIFKEICRDWQDLKAWKDLLMFGQRVLKKPRRGGRKGGEKQILHKLSKRELLGFIFRRVMTLASRTCAGSRKLSILMLP